MELLGTRLKQYFGIMTFSNALVEVELNQRMSAVEVPVSVGKPTCAKLTFRN